ncbi:ABC transporter permease [Fictibacillus phosphorivorans]|uniref:ABC transporter permease n=1 Tax=Fictibacillus phosphorivorans TaxID=1221500 RepID=UPI00203EB7EC|nr:ABC transporter permease subunit [Fictibacillus phosphorivorans]MCM3719423.1 ABC transporter permease subunit [Fictibacillus phosphorivorans]MCM3777099.1 ABC transporter permease subunit [Fictibacillus phosphorivorans]
MIKNVWRNPFFLAGFLFVFALISSSFYHHFVMNNEIYENQIIYDGITPVEKAPFEPSIEYWFGSDRMGADLFYQIISGAKYTLGIAFVASLLRIVLSFLGGILLLSAGRALSLIKGLSQSFYYIPSALLIFFIVGPVISVEQISFWEKAIFQVLLIVLIAVPNTAILMKEEISLIQQNEFITSAKLMGGNKFHILFKHIMPHLWPKLVLMYVQQVIAVLLLLAHLGILGVFFGGTIYREYGPEFEIPVSVSNEWSGLLGGYYYQLRLAPWLVFFPVLSFAAVIMAFNFMAEGIKRTGDQLPGRKKMKKIEEDSEGAVPVESFVFLSERKIG